jgi:monomeric phenylalanine-4-hydroxylase
MRATGWQIVAVPGLIPEEAFFALLAQRRFPVTDWIRKPEEFDYVVEPDVFHDLFGHVPLLFVPAFADYMQAYGAGGLKASRLDACELLARLYWYTVEFGLIRHGAGPARLWRRHPELGRRTAPQRERPRGPRRVAFDLQRIMRSRYRIDSYQAGYFVIDSFRPALRSDGARLHALVPAGARDASRAKARSKPASCCPARREFRSSVEFTSQRWSSAQGSGGRPCAHEAPPARWQLRAPGSVAVAGGKTMLSQWL